MKTKGLALIVVVGFIVATSILVGTIALLVFNQNKLSELKFRRLMGSYAAQAGLQYGMELLRLGTTYDNSTAYCLSGDVAMLNSPFCDNTTPLPGAGVADSNLVIPENGLNFTVTLRIGTMGSGGFSASRPVTSHANYTYTSSTP